MSRTTDDYLALAELYADEPADVFPYPNPDAEPNDPSFDAACWCGSYEPCPHDLIEWVEEIAHVC
jgi:hypothetical protein